MREMASELEVLPKDICDNYDFNDCKTLEEIETLLQEMVNLDYHLVGTRGYVYASQGMLSEVKKLIYKVLNIEDLSKIVHPWNQITRTRGLRGKLMSILLDQIKEEKALNKDKEEDNGESG
jgi:hypothetical protein